MEADFDRSDQRWEGHSRKLILIEVTRWEGHSKNQSTASDGPQHVRHDPMIAAIISLFH